MTRQAREALAVEWLGQCRAILKPFEKFGASDVTPALLWSAALAARWSVEKSLSALLIFQDLPIPITGSLVELYKASAVQPLHAESETALKFLNLAVTAMEKTDSDGRVPPLVEIGGGV